ncbi:MAG TPA: methyl-accepting chemotaxis protein [Methylomirabilota bacterium]|nr:methyl-accepting chemotaxis protein [Methylomirabilota bacterium]
MREGRRRLAEAAHALQERFLALGSRLEALHCSGQRLVAQAESLLALALGHGDGQRLLGAAAALAGDTLEFIAASERKSRELVAALRETRSRTRSLSRGEHALNQCVAPLKFIQVLFHIEAVRLPSGIRENFVSLIEEIGRLTAHIQEAVRQRFRQIQPANQVILTLEDHLRHRVSSFEETLRTRQSHLRVTLAGLQSDLARNQTRDARLPRVSQTIARAIGQVVMNLQVQDIINQKLEHVGEAIDQMSADLERLDSAASAQTASTSRGSWKQTSHLQAAQLAAARSDLEQAAQSISGALRSVLDLAAKLDADCLSLGDAPPSHTAIGDNGAAALLRATLGDLRATVAALVQDVQRDCQIAAPIEQMASNLSSTVKRMASDIHLLALNAHVQAAQTGEGTGLSTLATGLAQVSVEIAKLNETIVADLDSVGDSLTGLTRTLTDWLNQGRQHLSRLGQTGSEHECALMAYQEQASQCSREIAFTVEQIVTEARAALVEVEEALAILEPAHRLQEALETLAQSLPDAPADQTDAGGSPTDRLVPRYTMESERAVHRQILGVVPNGAVFVPGPQPVQHQARPQRSPDASPGTDGSSASAHESMNLAAVQSERFGDNVELF